MNIAVISPDLINYYFRPDTTLNREVNDYYLPKGVSELTVTPCIYTKLIKPGKAVGEKFVARYISEYDFGLLFDAKGLETGIATSMDFTSILPCNYKSLEGLSEEIIEINLNEINIYKIENLDKEALFKAITTISEKSSLRYGDIVAVALPNTFEVSGGNKISYNDISINIL